MSEREMAIRQALGIERLGEILYRSGYFADARSQAQAIVKILAGAELDFGPIASMKGFHIIEGQPSMSAGLIAAAIQRSDRYRYRVVEHDDTHCIIDFFEIADGKREKLGTSKFDAQDAKAAGLLERKGGMWTKYPRNMYFSRALTNGARWYTPDIFGGPVFTPDELGAEVDESGNAIQVYEAPAAPDERVVPTRERDVQDAPRRHPVMVESSDERVWQRWEEVRSKALKYGVVPPKLSLPIGYNQLVSNATMVKAQTEAKLVQLEREETARAAARAERDAPALPGASENAGASAPQPASPHPSVASVWERNKALMDEAWAAGFRQLRDLPGSTPLEEVEARNQEILGLLAQKV